AAALALQPVGTRRYRGGRSARDPVPHAVQADALSIGAVRLRRDGGGPSRRLGVQPSLRSVTLPRHRRGREWLLRDTARGQRALSPGWPNPVSAKQIPDVLLMSP